MPVRRARERVRRWTGVGNIGLADMAACVGEDLIVEVVGLGFGVDAGNAGKSFRRRSSALIMCVSERNDAFGASPRGSMGMMVVLFSNGFEPAGDGVLGNLEAVEVSEPSPPPSPSDSLSLARHIACTHVVQAVKSATRMA